MPHSMPFGDQKYKWFALFFMAGLPFLVLYRWMKGELVYLENPNRRIIKKINKDIDE